MAGLDTSLGVDIRNSLIGTVTEIAQFTLYDYRHHRGKIAESRNERAKKASQKKQQGAGDALGGNDGDIPNVALPPDQELGLINDNAGTEYGPRELVFKVQFNPSELSLNSSVLPINKQSVMINADKVEKAPDGATANLNVNLIFDKMNALDAFVMDNGMLSAGGAIGSATNIGKTFTVRHEVEALLAALRDENTRQAEFRWNKFVFDGYLQYVQVRYTMFSPSGHPVRAVVAIRMKREASANDTWVQDFDTAFSGDGGQLGSRTQGGGIGGVINL